MQRTSSKVFCAQCRKSTTPDPNNTKRCFSCGALYAPVSKEAPKPRVAKASQMPARKRRAK